MPNKHGDFVWYELMVSDADAAADFYGSILGWDCRISQNSGAEGYREWWMGDAPIGGLLPLSAEMKAGGAHPAWLGYIHVDDVDAQVEKLKAAGANILMGPMDIPGVGRFVMILDPQGVPLYVMTDTSGQTSTAFAATEPMAGHCAWNELAASDPGAAKRFYGGQFGWAPNGDMDMGPLGKYEFWKVGDERGHMIGAVMPKMAEMPVSMWTFYFRVPDIDKAAATVRAKGGTVLVEPMEIPGGEFSLNVMDPQGAVFGLVGPRL
jgi:predicted enzyme related to lactoylglutathione lyase